MSTRATPEQEAAIKLQAQTARLAEIKTDLLSYPFSPIAHPVARNAAADVMRAITMLVENARRYPTGNQKTFTELVTIALDHPDYATTIVRGIAENGGLEAALALKEFPKARSAEDAAAYVDAVIAAKDKFPPRTVELVYAAIAHKNPAAANKVLAALVDLENEFGVGEALSLTYNNAERVAHLLPLLAAKPGYELPVAALLERDTKRFLPLAAYVDALSNFGTDQSADCLQGIAANNHRSIADREVAIQGIQRIASDHAVELLGNFAFSKKELRIPSLRALFTLREAALEGGRNDLSLFDQNLRHGLNAALVLVRDIDISNTDEVSALKASFKRADEIDLGGGAGSYSDLFNQVVQVENFRRELQTQVVAFTTYRHE